MKVSAIAHQKEIQHKMAMAAQQVMLDTKKTVSNRAVAKKENERHEYAKTLAVKPSQLGKNVDISV